MPFWGFSHCIGLKTSYKENDSEFAILDPSHASSIDPQDIIIKYHDFIEEHLKGYKIDTTASTMLESRWRPSSHTGLI